MSNRVLVGDFEGQLISIFGFATGVRIFSRKTCHVTLSCATHRHVSIAFLGQSRGSTAAYRLSRRSRHGGFAYPLSREGPGLCSQCVCLSTAFGTPAVSLRRILLASLLPACPLVGCFAASLAASSCVYCALSAATGGCCGVQSMCGVGRRATRRGGGGRH